MQVIGQLGVLEINNEFFTLLTNIDANVGIRQLDDYATFTTLTTTKIDVTYSMTGLGWFALGKRRC